MRRFLAINLPLETPRRYKPFNGVIFLVMAVVWETLCWYKLDMKIVIPNSKI